MIGINVPTTSLPSDRMTDRCQLLAEAVAPTAKVSGFPKQFVHVVFCALTPQSR
jgi:hypothetical protein